MERELAERVFMGTSLRTRSEFQVVPSLSSSSRLVGTDEVGFVASFSTTTSPSCSVWPIQVPARTAPSSSSRLRRPITSMESTSYSESKLLPNLLPYIPFPSSDINFNPRVIAGRSVVRLIEDSPTKSDSPSEEIIISDCGELAEGEDDGIPLDPHADGYEEFPSDDERDVHDVSPLCFPTLFSPRSFLECSKAVTHSTLFGVRVVAQSRYPNRRRNQRDGNTSFQIRRFQIRPIEIHQSPSLFVPFPSLTLLPR